MIDPLTVIEPATIGRPCEECSAPIPHRAYQNPHTVRACSASCAGRIARRESLSRPLDWDLSSKR